MTAARHLVLGPLVRFAGEREATVWVARAGPVPGAASRRAGSGWAAFEPSFERVAELVRNLAAGAHGRPPATVVALSGDVHYSYLAEAARLRGPTRFHQAVCSSFRNPLTRRERRAHRFGLSAAGRAIGSLLARTAGVRRSRLSWRVTRGPWFENCLGSLDIEGGEIRFRIERCAAPRDRARPPALSTVALAWGAGAAHGDGLSTDGSEDIMIGSTTPMVPEALSALLQGGDGPALVTPGDAAPTRHDRLSADVDSLARRLAGVGVRRGDCVALVLPNGPEIVEAVLAVTAIGAAAAPLNPAYTHDELAFYLGDLHPRLLVLPFGSASTARGAAQEGVEIVDLVPTPGSAPALLLRGREVAPLGSFEPGTADDAALLLYTSGTTSRPKQVQLLQRNLTASARTIAEHYRLGRDDVSYCAMPLFHVHGLVASALAAFAGGGSIVLPRRLAPRRFWREARAAGITWLSAGPTLHAMLLEHRDAEGPPATLRFVRSCSSALPAALMRRAEEAYGVPMLEAYGMTEASHQLSSAPLPPAPRPAGSVGIATGTEIRIVDPGRRFLPDGEAGEVVVRGPGIMPGYRGNPEANAESFFDGWFRTGDKGVLERGYLRLEGRLKELIIRGGENIWPAEIEDVLKAHPAVADAACFGIPDETYGEEVGVAVSLSGTADERTLIDHCRNQLTAVKVPKRVFLLPEIPRTPTGKLQRRRIAESLLAEGPSP